MTKTMISVMVASVALMATPALAQVKGKITAWDGRDKITVGGKTFEISPRRTIITINGATATHRQFEVGMECTVTGVPVPGEAISVSC